MFLEGLEIDYEVYFHQRIKKAKALCSKKAAVFSVNSIVRFYLYSANSGRYLHFSV